MLIAILSVLFCNGQDINILASKLASADNYISDAVFEVLLPNASEPVTYDVTLQSSAAPADTLSACDYLIRWSATSSAEPIQGFSAYYDGNHYRYRNNKLQEYHAEASLNPFMPLGSGTNCRNGVQKSVQFAELLPQFIAETLTQMVADTSYIYTFHPDTLVNGAHRIVVDGVKRRLGYDQQLYSYVFDRDTYMPVYIETTSSPGSISEQIATTTYCPSAHNIVEISEEGLAEQWPDIFELYRESTFKSENMVNAMLPKFACQMLGTDQRYIHNANEPLAAPTVLVFLDPNVSTAQQTIDEIRETLQTLPREIEILWIFNSNRSDEIDALVGRMGDNEHTLISANSLVRNCGITMFPTIFIANSASKITDVISGLNNDTALVVLQKTMLL